MEVQPGTESELRQRAKAPSVDPSEESEMNHHYIQLAFSSFMTTTQTLGTVEITSLEIGLRSDFPLSTISSPCTVSYTVVGNYEAIL